MWTIITKNHVKDREFSDKDSRPKLLIIGDSFSQDFVNSYNENGYLKKYQVSGFYIPADCQIYAAKDNSKGFYFAENPSICEKTKNVKDIKDKIADADIVILASNWREWSAERLPETIEVMDLRKNQKIYVLGPKAKGHKYRLQKWTLRLWMQKFYCGSNNRYSERGSQQNASSASRKQAMQ